MFKTIDINKEPQKVELFLAKPDKTVIAKLSDAYGKRQNIKFGQVNELAFTLPYMFEKDNEMVRSRHIDKVKERYLIKAQKGLQVEWYIITRITESSNETSNTKEIECFSLPYETKDKLINNYKPKVEDDVEVPCNPSYILDDILVITQNITKQMYQEDTSGDFWKKGYVDADLDLKFRLFEITSATLLDCLYQIAETFNALIVWDTEKREINLYNPDNIGTNRGLKFSYNKYLLNVSRESSTDEMVTRLKVFGKDISINAVNPTGANHIEDFSFFMYPFSRDVNKNVIQSSYYMSDSLCNALLDYQEKITTSNTNFNNLLLSKSTLQNQLYTKQNELFTLQTNLKIKQNDYDILVGTGGDTTAIAQEISILEGQIATKQAEILTLENDIKNIDAQINDIGTSLAVENNFTFAQMRERNKYIIEKEWRSDSHTDAQELYDDAIKEFERLKKPQTVITIGIINFLELVECQYDWNKLVLGDTVMVEYEHFNLLVEAKIIEINIDYETGNVDLTIANVKELLSDEEKLIKMLYQSNSTSTTVDVNKYVWDDSKKNKDEVQKIIDILQGKIRDDLNLAFNDYVTIDNRGLTITTPENELEFLRATHGILAITNDGGNTYKNAITTKGVVADNLYGKVIAGSSLTITNTSGAFTMDANGFSVKQSSFSLEAPDGTDVIDSYGSKIGALEQWKSSAELKITDDSIIATVTNSQTYKVATENIASGIASTAQQNAINYVKNTTGNLVNNITKSGNLDKWKLGGGTGFTLVQKDFLGSTVPVQQVYTDGNTQVYSDDFEVDPSKAYEVTLWFNTDGLGGTDYFGLHALDSTGTVMGIDTIRDSDGELTNVANTNPYFWSGDNAPINTWVKRTAYIMPTGTSPADMKKIGNNVSSNMIMLPTTKKIRIRWLNYYNNWVFKNVWVANPKVVEVDPNVVIASAKAIMNAEKAQSDATKANGLLEELASDSKLAPSEKIEVKREWDIIVAEKPTIEAQATTYAITTEKTNFTSAYTTLNNYITPFLTDLGITSDIDGATFRTNFKNYYSTKSILLKKISDSAKFLADTAQDTADDINDNKLPVINNNIEVIRSTTESGYITTNPIFASWGGSSANYPTGMTHWTGSFYAKKDSTFVKNGGFGLRFQNTGTNNAGAILNQGFFKPNIANNMYLVVEIDFYLVSGSTSGAGILVDWGGMNPYRTQFSLQSAVNETIATGKWYSIRKTIKRPTDNLTGFTGMTGYLMANYSSLGTVEEKDIVFNRLAIREASIEETKAYESAIVIADMANDNMLTPVEKKAMKTEIDSIILEKPTLESKATAYGIKIENTEYVSAYQTLVDNVNPLLSSLNTTSSINGTNVRSYFTTYYDRRAILERALAEKIKIGSKNMILNSRFTKFNEETGILLDWDNQNDNFTRLTPEYTNPLSYIMSASDTGQIADLNKKLISNEFFIGGGEATTVSFEISVNDINAWDVQKVFVLEFLDSDGTVIESATISNSQLETKIEESGIWNKITYTYSVVNETVNRGRLVFILARNGTINIREPKVERGFVATDFSIAPEDVEQDVKDLFVVVNDVKLKVETDKIVATVRSSESYKNDLADKASDASVNGEGGAIARIASLEVTAGNIDMNFKSSGGGNLLRNSVGYDSTNSWIKTGTVDTMKSKTLIDSGSCFVMKGGSLKQTIGVPPNQAYTISSIVYKKTTAGTGYLKISDSQNTYTINLLGTKSYNFEQITITIPKDEFIGNQITIELYGDATSNLWFTATMLNAGTYPFKWSHAHDEIYNTNINFNSNGIRVTHSELTNALQYTVMTPTKFAGYYSTDTSGGKFIVDESNGSEHETFRMDGDSFVMKNANVKNGIEMQLVKIIPVNHTSYKGWAFVSTT